jgi:hypothetical protein
VFNAQADSHAAGFLHVLKDLLVNLAVDSQLAVPLKAERFDPPAEFHQSAVVFGRCEKVVVNEQEVNVVFRDQVFDIGKQTIERYLTVSRYGMIAERAIVRAGATRDNRQGSRIVLLDKPEIQALLIIQIFVQFKTVIIGQRHLIQTGNDVAGGRHQRTAVVIENNAVDPGGFSAGFQSPDQFDDGPVSFAQNAEIDFHVRKDQFRFG